MRRNRLDEETLPLTFTRLWQKCHARVVTTKGSWHGKFGQRYQHIEVSGAQTLDLLGVTDE
jgi:hypothetical protein